MTTIELDTLTDKLTKTDAGMFPVAEKLLYYNIAYGLLYALIIDESEDHYEEEDTADTVAGQRDYGAPSRMSWPKRPVDGLMTYAEEQY